MTDLNENDEPDFEDDEDEDEVPDSVGETGLEYMRRKMAAGEPMADGCFVDAEMIRRAEEKARALSEEAALRAWEKQRLADAESREARLMPFDDRNPYEYRVDKRVPRVAPPKAKTASRYEPYTEALDEAETELTAVIAECRYFMREMVFESARTTPIASDRISFIESARSLAEVSAKVGHSIGVVRNPLLAEPDEKKKRARR